MLSRVQIVDFPQQHYEPLNIYAYGSDTPGTLVLEEAEGLGPVQANVIFNEYALKDGGSEATTSLEVRDLTLKISYIPDPSRGITIESLRRSTHVILAPGKRIRMRFYSVSEFTHEQYLSMVYTTGYVRTFEPNMFSKNPQSVVTIVCPNPYFLIPSRTIDYRTFEPFIIDNPGDAPYGFSINHFTQNTYSVSLENLTHGEKFTVTSPLEADRKLYVKTHPGNKAATLYHLTGEVRARLWDQFEIEGGWPMLHPGRNEFIVKNGSSSISEGTMTYFQAFRGL